jgi:predicted Zn-ribbon and HTH transcriptional regulator
MPDRPPPERTQTVREALRQELLRGPATARELSERGGIREKDVAPHLEHLQRSLRSEGARLIVAPASCIACGYAFTRRSKLSRHGSCPECGSTRIDPPSFSISAKGQEPGQGGDEQGGGGA